MSESNNDELVSEIRVSLNYEFVFFSEQEVRNFLDSLLNRNGSPPSELNIAFMTRKLLRPYKKSEILSASPNELKKMLGINS